MKTCFVNYSCSTTFLMLLALCVLLKSCQCSNLNLTNASPYDWQPAAATWYGAPHGPGSTGGACGYMEAVEQPPYSAMVSAAGPSIYQSGQGCGVCYQVKCTNNGACSGKEVTVSITDECPGCNLQAVHFDLSGTAFGALAKPGLDDQLRNAGILQLQYRKVKCYYKEVTVAVRVDQGSSQYYFAGAIEFEDGSGIAKVELQPKSGGWINMYESWGAVWAVSPGFPIQAPISIRLTEKESGQTLVLSNVIPEGWQPGQTYRSKVNFN